MKTMDPPPRPPHPPPLPTLSSITASSSTASSFTTPTNTSLSTTCALAYYDELGQVWQFLERYFKAQLPLRDVAWRTPTPSGTSGSTLVTISTLPVQVLAHDHALFKNLGGSGRTSDYRAPYAHLNLVVCETAEAYKSAVKAKVKAWVDERIERHEEWLLVYVPLGTQNNTHEMYLKIHAKLAADFCSKMAGDRSSMLTLFEQGVSGSMGGGGPAGPGAGSGVMLQQNHQEQWGDVMTKIKTVVGNTFIARSKAYQEQVRALEEGVGTAAAATATTAAAAPGEDFFFRLFFAKESLALMNEQLQLPGEALHHYQELSVLTNRWQAALMPSSSETESSNSSSVVVPPKALMMFQPSRAPSSSGIGGGVPVLDFPVFEFRVRLEARGGLEGSNKGESRVGMLEVQQYLFAREAGFLLQLGRYSELFRRTHAFITLQHQTLLRLLPPPSPPPPSTAAEEEEASDVGARDSAHLWALVAGWTVLQMWEDFLKQQQQQQQVQPSALPTLASSTSSPSPSPLPPMAVPQPDATATATAWPPPPSLNSTLRASSASSLGPAGSSSGSNAASKVIILEPGLMARNLAELLDFIRVRFWDLGLSLLGPQKLQEESIVCAARRDTLISHKAGPSSTPSPRRPELSPPPSSSSPQVLTSLSDIDAFLRSSSNNSSNSSSSSNEDGGAPAGLEDPRRVALSSAALFSRAAPWMRETLNSVSAFDEQYLRVTEVLVRYLEKGGRERFVGRVQAERASILLRRGEWEEARKVLRRLAEHNLRKDFWVPLLSQVLRQLARCEKERGNAKAYVGTLLQILSLQCLDEATGAYYRSELDEYVRQRMPSSSSSSSSSSSPRLIRPLSLLVTARVKSTAKDLAPIPPSVELGKPASVIVWLHSALKQPLPVDGLTLILGDVRQLRKRRRLGADYGWMTGSPPASTSSAAATTGSDIDGGLVLSPPATTPRSPGPSPRRNTDLAASNNNLGSTISGSSSNMNVSSPRLSSVLASEMTTTGTAAAAAAEEEQQPEDYITWKLSGPLTLEPGINELELVTTSLPPPGTYVYEKLILQWGSLVLEQDQLAALDPDTLDAATKQRPPPRRFSALAKVPVRRAVGLTVVAKPPATSLAVLTSPVSPPDSQHVHHLSVLLDTHSDTLTAPMLTLTQPALKALAVKGPALLAFYPQKNGNDDQEEEDAPLREEEVEVAWDGATATMFLPPFLPPRTSLILTVALHPLPEVVDAFVRGRQDHQRLVSVQVQLTAEFNKDNFLPRRGDAEQEEAAAAAAAAVATASDAVSPRSSMSSSAAPNITAPTNQSQNQRRRSLSPTTGTWGHDVLEEALRRNTLRAGCEIVIQQPFSVTISVQGCSHWRSSRRYFVQALLRNRAPLPVTLHACHLRLPPSYRIVVQEDDDDDGSSSSNQGAHLRDLLLAPGQDVRYAYLIERIVSAAAAGTEAAASSSSAFREAPSKMSVSADYTWESLRPINQARVRRHHPPQQQQSFERYFQDSAMLNRGDTLRTFVVRAQLVPAASPSSSSLLSARDSNGQEDVAAAAAFQQDQQQHHLLLPACMPATPGDVEERGVVVGHFQNRVTEGVVGVALRLELAVELSEEAAREAMAATAATPAAAAGQQQEGGGRGRFRLIYEVAADPADWAVWGVTKGTVEVGPPAADDDGSNKQQQSSARVVLECKLVPVRAGLLACPALTFEPVDVRAAVSPRSRHKSNVRWVGPRDILVVCARGLKRIPTVRLV